MRLTKYIRYVALMIISIALVYQMMLPTNASTTITTTYQSSDEDLINPERGFYVPFDPIGGDGKDGVYTLALSDLQKVREQKMSLIRRIYLLSEFRNKPISPSFLQMISNDCEVSRQAGIKMIIRFSYNWLGGGPDAPRDIILSHLEQLNPILQQNYDVIAYMEAGFIGYWGEWHTSSNNILEIESSNITDDARNIFKKILTSIPLERMVAIRYPRQKKQIFNNDNPITMEEVLASSPRGRTGFHNDAFRASIDDASTYGYTNDKEIIEKEKQWVSIETQYVLQGGEPAWASDPPEYDDCEGALNDLAQMHWSGMNIDQADPAAKSVYQGWKDQGCMEVIKRRLGYRFRLLDSSIPKTIKPGGIFSMSYRVVNDGWAAPYNPRQLEVILLNRETGREYYLPLSENLRLWMPNMIKTVEIVSGIPVDIPIGTYEVLLNLPDPTSRFYNRPEYSIRLANENVWQSSTGYNSLLQSVDINLDAPVENYSGDKFFKLR